jgi:hypothetical protein
MERESLREIHNLTARKKMMDQRMCHSFIHTIEKS